MPQTIYIDPPRDFSFRHTVYSHGWYDLPPFRVDEVLKLHYVFRANGSAVPAVICEENGRLRVDVGGSGASLWQIERDVRRILRLDDELESFYRLARKDAGLAWAAEANAGRLLRSPTVFEDLVKTLCTTNCSWSLTRNMVTNLVEKLGQTSADGERRAFPTPEALASAGPEFYRDEIRAGYRSPYFAELAEKVASGGLDPESWLVSDLPTAELKKQIKSVKGVGDYAAENMLKLLGRYDGMALDSWLRAQFYKKHNREKQCPDAKIARHYKKFGDWKGLAIWCDMTERWFDEAK